MSNPILLVVRRGNSRRFDSLKRQTTALPVEVIWDRRQRPRRVSERTSLPERRRAERRQGDTYTWEVADFVVAVPEADTRPK